MQGVTSLPIDLRLLRNLLGSCCASGAGMTPEECGRVALLLNRAVKEADLIVGQAELVTEIEDELHAVVFGLDLARAPDQTAYQVALTAQQREIQRQLDGGGAEPVSRPGLAALAMRVPDTNIVVIPIAPRPRPLGGGDAA